MISIVLGLGFGDEGKGRVTDQLCQQMKDPIVVRFNGGPQAGHTVTKDNKPHIFASFGSGTLSGAVTFWSSYCPFHPVFFMNELNALKERGVTPEFHIALDSPLITPFDVSYNRSLELGRDHEHGSCGMGIGATIQRQEDNYKIFVGDLRYPAIISEKIDNIRAYYKSKMTRDHEIKQWNEAERSLITYVKACSDVLQHINIVNETEFFRNNSSRNFVFEGAQGIMLDMDHGIFPHVTRSNTTSRNALELIRKHELTDCPTIYYLTRAYQTRHGSGPMTGREGVDFYLQNLEGESNVTNQWQGDFKRSMLDVDTLNYAIERDNIYSSGLMKVLVITCLDQLKTEDIPCTIANGKDIMLPPSEIGSLCKTNKVLLSDSPNSEDQLKVAQTSNSEHE